MVALGFGKFARADRIFALERITGEERGDGLELDEALDLAARLAAAADAGRVDLSDLGRRARRLLASTTKSASA